jgi:uncharacterized protein YecT (DUF1311 family)
MTRRWPLLMGLVASVLFAGTLGVAAQSSCPLKSNDACDQWAFEQADKELAAVIAAARIEIDRFAHPDTRQEAGDALFAAHSLWVEMRAADCRADSALMWLRSARTREGYTAACMHAVTLRRIGEIKRRYHLPN